MQRIFVLLSLATVLVATAHWPLTVVAAEPTPPEQHLLNAQMANQTAQAAYYQKQLRDKSLKEQAQDALGSLLGVLLGGALTLLGGWYANNRQWQLEEHKWQQLRIDLLYLRLKVL